MTIIFKAMLTGFACALSAALWAGPASAQYQRYEGGYERGYERRGGYEQRGGYERRERSERRGSYEGGRDYEREPRRAGPQGRGAVGNMTLEEQKRAMRNQKEAQKKAIKRGYAIQ